MLMPAYGLLLIVAIVRTVLISRRVDALRRESEIRPSRTTKVLLGHLDGTTPCIGPLPTTTPSQLLVRMLPRTGIGRVILELDTRPMSSRYERPPVKRSAYGSLSGALRSCRN